MVVVFPSPLPLTKNGRGKLAITCTVKRENCDKRVNVDVGKDATNRFKYILD